MQPPRVTYSATDHSADALYLARAHVPDAFLAVEYAGNRIGLFGALEYGRMEKSGVFTHVLSLEEYYEKTREVFDIENPGPGDLLAVLAMDLEVESVLVGSDFPAIALRQAEERELPVDIAEGPLFPERQIKNDYEAGQIRLGNEAACAGFAEVERMLAAASVGQGGVLMLDGEPLTSERMHRAIALACINRNAFAFNTIVAGGDQGCDPHCEGSGPLKAGELIVVDIFPRLDKSGYYGDMTRTYLKGSPSAEQRRLVETVAEGQKLALGKLCDGADGKAIHYAVTDFFTAKGYPTEKRQGRSVGFFHGLGHGLGLDIHEAPRMNRSGALLAAGNVVTVEPGLYYAGLGGCRIEDNVRVTKTGYELLSQHPYDWVIE